MLGAVGIAVSEQSARLVEVDGRDVSGVLHPGPMAVT
jgi:hypothetical protein